MTKASSPSLTGFVARGAYVFAVLSDPGLQQPVIVALNSNADAGSRKTVLDPNALDKTGHIAFIGSYPPRTARKVRRVAVAERQ